MLTEPQENNYETTRLAHQSHPDTAVCALQRKCERVSEWMCVCACEYSKYSSFSFLYDSYFLYVSSIVSSYPSDKNIFAAIFVSAITAQFSAATGSGFWSGLWSHWIAIVKLNYILHLTHVQSKWISLFSNGLSRKQLWPEKNVITIKRKKKKWGGLKSQVGFAGLGKKGHLICKQRKDYLEVTWHVMIIDVFSIIFTFFLQNRERIS